MNYFPSLKVNIYHKFNNPLSGFIYDNKKYEDSCIMTYETKEKYSSCNNINKSKSNSYQLYETNKNRQKTKQKTQTKSQHEILLNESKISNVTKRLTQHKRLVCSRNTSLNRSPSHSLDNSFVKNNITKAIDINKQIIHSTSDIDYTPYVLPNINALILDLFHHMNDKKNICKLDLKKYFYLFSRDSLLGSYSRQFIELYQRHIDKILLKNNIQYNQQCIKRNVQLQLPGQYININSKKILYQKLLQCQKNNKYQILQRLIQFYCLPLPAIRAVFMKDLLDMISTQLYQNFNCHKNASYVLINNQGFIIEDFAEIKFTTTQIFISEQGRQSQNLERYKLIYSNHKANKNRYNFRQTLKSNFRKYVVKGKYEQSPQQIMKSTPIKKSMQQFAILNQSKANRSKIKLKFKQYLQKQVKNQQKDKSQTKIVVNRQLSHTSLQKKRNIKAQQIRIFSKKQQEDYISIRQKLTQQFKLLQIKNIYKNIKLKENQFKDKLQLDILITQCIFFKDKSQQQIIKILQCLDFINSYDQDYHKVLIVKDDYIKMRKIINCIAQKDHIIHFVGKYLGYDDYGEVQKSDLSSVLSFIVNREKNENQAKTTDVILKIIWNWLQKNGVIVNNCIKKGDMQRQYESNKLIYYFLISLIFGTNEITALDLAQQILI